MAGNSEFNREEIRSRLEKIIERDGERGRQQVGLFASRCALRIYPMAIDQKIFHPRQRLHLVALWRVGLAAICLQARKDVSYDSLIAITVAANDIEDSNEYPEEKTALIRSFTSAAFSFTADQSSFPAFAVDAAASAFSLTHDDAPILQDLDNLELQSGLSLSDPLWPDQKTPLQKQIGRLMSACQELGLSQITKDYQVLLDGGKQVVVVAKSWNDYERLWEEVQKHPDLPPAKVQESVSESANSKTSDEASEKIIHSPGFAYWSESIADQDHLNRGALVDALSHWISHKANKQHITLGLFGHWGAGKSTFLKLLKDKLIEPESSQDTQIIWGEFNAWRYEHSDNIQAGIAQEVVGALKEQLSWRDRLELTARYIWKKHKLQLLALSTWLAVTAGITLWVWGADASATKGISRALIVPPMLLLALLWTFKFIKQATSHPLANILKTYLRLPHFGEHLGTIPVMHEQIKALLSIRLAMVNRPFWKVFTKKPEQRFVFVVDDLDRCSPEGVVKTLEAVRLVMDLPNVVVIIAIDPRVALAALALHYEKLSEHHTADPVSIARDYLGKVMHVPIVLEEPPQQDIHAYLEQHLWADESASEVSEPLVEKDNAAALDASLEPIVPDVTEPSDTAVFEEIPDTEKAEETAIPQLPVTDPTPPAISSVTRLSPLQKQAFKHWVDVFRFSNPRQIKRLNNAYALIRLRYPEDQPVTVGDNTGFAPSMFPRLAVMLWLEYVHEQSTEDRCVLLACFEEDTVNDPVFVEAETQQPAQIKAQQRHADLWKQVREAVSEDKQLLSAYRETRAFVLPAVERVVTQKPKEKAPSTSE
jgi:energy-coupling factor transporter ATP-binding protein EcfA2